MPDLKDPNLTIELKFDGYRAILYIEDGKAYFHSRNAKKLNQFQQLADKICKELHIDNAILDGEIVAIDPETYLCNISQLRQRKVGPHPIVYLAFDLLWMNGHDLRLKPLAERKAKLKRLISHKKSIYFVWGETKEKAINVVAEMSKRGFEGVVLKKKRDIYSSSTRWFKYLNPHYIRKRALGE